MSSSPQSKNASRKFLPSHDSFVFNIVPQKYRIEEVKEKGDKITKVLIFSVLTGDIFTVSYANKA